MRVTCSIDLTSNHVYTAFLKHTLETVRMLTLVDKWDHKFMFRIYIHPPEWQYVGLLRS
jgi:hypothetical protein